MPILMTAQQINAACGHASTLGNIDKCNTCFQRIHSLIEEICKQTNIMKGKGYKDAKKDLFIKVCTVLKALYTRSFTWSAQETFKVDHADQLITSSEARKMRTRAWRGRSTSIRQPWGLNCQFFPWYLTHELLWHSLCPVFRNLLTSLTRLLFFKLFCSCGYILFFIPLALFWGLGAAPMELL